MTHDDGLETIPLGPPPARRPLPLAIVPLALLCVLGVSIYFATQPTSTFRPFTYSNNTITYDNGVQVTYGTTVPYSRPVHRPQFR